MHLVILGAPGSGKGTQASRIAEQGSLRHVSTGDLLRDAVAAGSRLGKQVEKYLASGELVPDEVVLELVKEALTDHSRDEEWNGWILDGYPRTIAQAEALEEVLSSSRETVDGVIVLDVAPEVIVKRLSNRRTCVSCNKIYNLLNDPPGKENVCDACGGKLVQREDDRPETIRKRLEVYERQTRPIVGFYETLYDVFRVDGSKSIEEVDKEIRRLVNI